MHCCISNELNRTPLLAFHYCSNRMLGLSNVLFSWFFASNGALQAFRWLIIQPSAALRICNTPNRGVIASTTSPVMCLRWRTSVALDGYRCDAASHFSTQLFHLLTYIGTVAAV
ncbi:hypothetical protein AF72_12955 [Xylella taiwanensis]|uniref:Uncharacterized protein n=1 Tax=Xylella taiwanensis TaxID=1444770 RepID=Z9JGX0_9GAMM|nr:hypothetical protein AF72_12955 [Xylella taiwanensis]